MATYSLHCPDNDSNMCGSDDRLFGEVKGIPVCRMCGYKTDPYVVNSLFRVKRRVYDLSSTYDGYEIASMKFKEVCMRLELGGLEFLPLPADTQFFVVKPTVLTAFDYISRQTHFESLCAACGFYKSVAGATPAFLLSEPESDLSGTDILFGSGNSRGRMLIATERARTLLMAEKLKGLEFEATMHNYSSKPTADAAA